MDTKHMLPQAKDINNESSENTCDNGNLQRSWARKKASNDDLKS